MENMFRLIVAALLVVGPVHVAWGSSVSDTADSAATLRGTTGGVLVDSADPLGAGRVRVGLSVSSARGGSSNPLDGLDEPGSDNATVTVARATLALGLPWYGELAVMMPYIQVTPEGLTGTGGRGDLVLSLKQRLWHARRLPSATVTASYLASTAADDRPVRTVSHEAYRASLVLQSPLRIGALEQGHLAVEVGGLFKDQGRIERDEILLYGLNVTLPLPREMGGIFDARTGIFGRHSAGRYALVLEAAGTRFRGDRTPHYDDSISVIPGIRYATSRWGVTAAGTYTTYRRGAKRHALGGSILAHASF